MRTQIVLFENAKAAKQMDPNCSGIARAPPWQHGSQLHVIGMRCAHARVLEGVRRDLRRKQYYKCSFEGTCALCTFECLSSFRVIARYLTLCTPYFFFF